MKQLGRQPWLGLESYRETDADLFFGRDRESLELLRLVRREVLTVLFGPSGTGKTSLLNAGLSPRLRESGFLPISIRLDHSSEHPDYAGQIRILIDQALHADAAHPIEEQALAPAPTERETLWEYLHRVVFWDWRNNPVTLALVFDQFEEVFTLGRNRAAVEEFLAALADLVENYIPAAVRSRTEINGEPRGETIPFPHDEPKWKVVLSLREDFVWRLDGLRKSMPSVMHNRYGIARMNGDQALMAVQEPGRGIVDEEVARQIVRFVAAADESRAGSNAGVPLEGLPVDPALLSVVCRELNTRRLEQEKEHITADLVEQSRVDILNEFYERSFAGLDAKVRVFVEDRLLTAGGFRGTVPLEDAGRAAIADSQIQTLIDRRLIRAEERLGIPHLELTHDLLTRVVLSSRAERQERERRELEKAQREEEERKRAEEEQSRMRELQRARRLLATAGAAVSSERRSAWRLMICLALFACLLIGFGGDPFKGLDRRWGDTLLQLRFRFGLEPKPDPRVFLVGIETKDLAGASTAEAEYRVYADILDILTDLQVSSVGMDLIMTLGGAQDARGVLESIRNNGHVVLAEMRTARSFPFAAPEFPSGLIDTAPDADGVHRRYSYGVFNGRICEPSLALSTYVASFRPPRKVTCTAAGGQLWKELSADSLTMVERKIPAGSRLLNFRSPWTEPWDRGFKYINASDLLAKHKTWQDAGADPGRIPAGLPTRGNLALIGSVGTAGDAGATPFGTDEPFVELQATALDDLLQARSLTELSTAGTIGITLAGILLIAMAGRWLRSMPALLLSAALIVVILILSFVALVRADIVIPAITPAAFMAIALLAESLRRANLRSLEKAFQQADTELTSGSGR